MNPKYKVGDVCLETRDLYKGYTFVVTEILEFTYKYEFTTASGNTHMSTITIENFDKYMRPLSKLEKALR